MTRLYTQIKNLRAARGLTQVQLADQAGVALATIQNVEGLRANLELATLESIVKVLGFSLDLRAEELDWNLLAHLGVPVVAQKTLHFRPERKILIDSLRQSVPALSQIQKNSREHLALQGFLLAIRDHYSSIWKQIPKDYTRGLTPKKITGPLIKLRRMAIRRLSEYL